ncbi:histidine phosphatase family protein [[Pasteurella] aerogenes]
MKKQLTFYFVRHGRTVWNQQGLMQGSVDSPLVEEGIIGAKMTGKALQNVPFVAAYSSLLQRTIDTTKYILGDRPIPFFHHQGFNEHYFGSWEGKQIDTIRDTQEFQQMLTDPANYKALSNQGETYEQLGKRALAALNDIIQVHQSGNILIVSHGHTLRLLIALLNGATWQNHRDANRSQSLFNTSISIVHYQQEQETQPGKFVVEKINSITHLPTR